MAKRTDANQREIVEATRKMGASVYVLSNVGLGFPDLIVGIDHENYLWEVKDGNKCPSARQLTLHQERFHNSWAGQVDIIYSVDDAINFINSRRGDCERV